MNIIESIRVIIARLINYNHLMTVNDKNYKHPIAELPNFLRTKKNIFRGNVRFAGIDRFLQTYSSGNESDSLNL